MDGVVPLRQMSDDRELPRWVRVVMAGVLAAILAAFVLLGAVLWASSGDGECDGPKITADCHRE